MLSRSSTGMPVADARDDSLRARRGQVGARAARRVAGGRRRARVLEADGLLGLGPAIVLAAEALAAVPAGRAMDRFGRIPVLALGLGWNVSFVAALATGAVVLVTIPALWILRGGRRRDGSQMNDEGLGRRPCTSTRSRLDVEATR